VPRSVQLGDERWNKKWESNLQKINRGKLEKLVGLWRKAGRSELATRSDNPFQLSIDTKTHPGAHYEFSSDFLDVSQVSASLFKIWQGLHYTRA